MELKPLKRFIRKNFPEIYDSLMRLNSRIVIFIRHRRSARSHLKKINACGKRVYCEPGFQVYSGYDNIKIGSDVWLVDSLLNAGNNGGSILIEDFVFFGHRVMILARGHNHLKFGAQRQSMIIEAPVKIKTGAWIGSGSIILPGVTIGKNSVVAAGSVVNRNVADYTIVAGTPARFKKKIKK